MGMMLDTEFFDRDAQEVAIDLIGLTVAHKVEGIWLEARIIETEAYYMNDAASHASLGQTASREALFMPPGTIYMYYSRGKDSFNISCKGEGNAVLIKSGIPEPTSDNYPKMIEKMHQFNPRINGLRKEMYLCSGQTLIARSLGLKVTEWNKKTFQADKLIIKKTKYKPTVIIQTTRLGIPAHRDEKHMYRFVDEAFAPFCTQKPRADQPLQKIFIK